MYVLLQWLIIVFDLAIIMLGCLHLLRGKATWSHKAVRAFVYVVLIGLSGQVWYSLTVLMSNDVPELFPAWVLKDFGIGALLLLDMFKPSIYWAEEEK